MKDTLGKVWIIGIFLAILGLGVSLWWKGRADAQPAQIFYLEAEAQKYLRCPCYLLNDGTFIDINENEIPEYVFSCDSGLSRVHTRFIWVEMEKKNLHVLLAHSEKGWEVGGSPEPSEGVSWLLDRRKKNFLVIPAGQEEPKELIWNPEAHTIQFAEP
jgi:hypothetical protein